MPLTPEQQAKIRQKEAVFPDALKRDTSQNYFEGWFFVTLNTRDDVPVLSICEGNTDIVDGLPDAPHCRYTKLGRRVCDVWQSIPEFHSGAIVDSFEAMPEHIHGLLYLKPGNKEHLGKIIGGFMGACSHAYWDLLGIDWRKNHPTQGRKQPTDSCAAAHIIDRDRDHTRSYRGPALFVHGYNDMEPVTPAEVQTKRDYIRDQARKRLIKGDRHECFLVHRNCHSRNWTRERILMAISNDPGFVSRPEKRVEAEKNILARLASDSPRLVEEGLEVRLPLSFLGHKAIMANPRKLPLVCHRVDSRQFDTQCSAVMNAARQGWIIVSAFISQKEREIKEQLMTEQLPFIEIMDNGFSERYKPAGKAFYAVAENRLVQISPWTYEYQKESTVSREMCLVMNELVRVISNRDDDWWKK